MHKTSRRLSVLVAVYMIFNGIAMVGMRTMSLLTGQAPELQSEPWRIGMHLAAEFTTAVLLAIFLAARFAADWTLG